MTVADRNTAKRFATKNIRMKDYNFLIIQSTLIHHFQQHFLYNILKLTKDIGVVIILSLTEVYL